MNKILLATILFCSASCFATCPAGTQGSTVFDEARALIKRILGERVSNGSVASQKGGTLKILFTESSGEFQVAVYDKKINDDHKQMGPYVAEVCGGGGQIRAIVWGNEVVIEKVSPGVLSITIPSKGTFQFASINSSTEVAHADD